MALGQTKLATIYASGAGGKAMTSAQLKRAARPTPEAVQCTASYNGDLAENPGRKQPQLLAAHERAVRTELLARRRPPADGGCVAVLTDATIPSCSLLPIVCSPKRPATSWDFSLLCGIEVLVLFRSADRDYAMELCAALRRADCSRVVASAVRGVAAMSAELATPRSETSNGRGHGR